MVETSLILNRIISKIKVIYPILSIYSNYIIRNYNVKL